MTNFERIKAMSVEEMAELLCRKCCVVEEKLCKHYYVFNCVNEIKHWLESESKDV